MDVIYSKVPAEQVGRLREFRRDHPLKRLTVTGVEWEYIMCGGGGHTLLLLPGALSVGEALFPLITAFENDYRILAPSYALSLTMTGLCEGINHILETEGVDQVHVIGGSYGALVGQYFVRKFPEKACSLVLMHAFLVDPRSTLPLKLAGKFFPVLPRRIFDMMLRMRLNRLLLSCLRCAEHPEFEFWRAYLYEAIASDHFRNVIVHQNSCLLELSQQPSVMPHDLENWPGAILIIESDDDPAIPANDRKSLKETYPQAEVKTFRDAGHACSILKRKETISIIDGFLSEAISERAM